MDPRPDSPPHPAAPVDATLHLLRGARAGDEALGRAAFERLYAELHARAQKALAGERAGHTLQPTALVHEAWLRLCEPDGAEVADRHHFLALAARAMRRILIDHARGLRRLKRGGEARRTPLEELPETAGAALDPDLVLAIDAALETLRVRAPRAAELVELRYFGGLGPAEAAAVLDISESTAAREWRFARAFLAAELEPS